MPVWATALLTILQNAPQLIGEVKDIYASFSTSLSSDDRAIIDAALAAAKTNDAQATAMADTALDAASKR